MKASVVIRCGDDFRVFACIASIDVPAEIIVVINPNPKLEHQLSLRNIRYIYAPSGNLSAVSNVGFSAALCDKIIITDSDTVFEPGCLRAAIDALDRYDAVRIPLHFRYSGNFLSREVAKAREFVNSLPLVYTPGIGVVRHLPSKIGGYLFDNEVPYAVDANLNFRIRQERLSVLFLQGAGCVHDAESVRHDLKAARRIGAGCRISAGRLHVQYSKLSVHQIGKTLKGVHLRHYPAILKTKGVRVLLYQIVWDIWFYRGYWFG